MGPAVSSRSGGKEIAHVKIRLLLVTPLLIALATPAHAEEKKASPPPEYKPPTGATVDTRRVGQPNQSTLDKPAPQNPNVHAPKPPGQSAFKPYQPPPPQQPPPQQQPKTEPNPAPNN
jgi:hypothetical protein